MLLKYFRFLLIGLFLLVTGCFQNLSCKSTFSIDELPKAIINQPYLQKIEVSGGVIVDKNNIDWEVMPENSGLTIKRFINKESGRYGGIEIFGIPKFQGDITIRLYGRVYLPPSCYFDRLFTIKVNPE